MIKLNPFFNRYISLGNSYTHTHSNFGFRGQIIGMYKNWVAMAELNTSHHDLWGETLSKGEKLHSIAVGYNHEKFSIQGLVLNPFTKRYEQSVENLSSLAPNNQHAYSTQLGQIFILNLSFNLDFGKQRHSGGKRINNSDTDSGILSGTKYFLLYSCIMVESIFLRVFFSPRICICKGCPSKRSCSKCS